MHTLPKKMTQIFSWSMLHVDQSPVVSRHVCPVWDQEATGVTVPEEDRTSSNSTSNVERIHETKVVRALETSFKDVKTQEDASTTKAT